MRAAAFALGMLVLASALPAIAQERIPKDQFTDLHLQWSIGDRGTVLTLDYQLHGEGAGRSFLKASFKTTAEFLLAEGQTLMSDSEASQILAAMKSADFWRLPDDGKPDIGPHEGPNGIEYVTICYSGLEIRAQEYTRRKWIARKCPDRHTDPAVIALARTMISVAQKHFPDVAVGPMWREALQ